MLEQKTQEEKVKNSDSMNNIMYSFNKMDERYNSSFHVNSGEKSPIKKWLNEEKLQFSGIKVQITKNNSRLL